MALFRLTNKEGNRFFLIFFFLKEDGFGLNDNGQLGLGHEKEETTPTTIPGLNNAVKFYWYETSFVERKNI